MSTGLAIVLVAVVGVVAGWIGRWYWVEKRGHKA